MRAHKVEQTVCDRRILKAFYTQYVAVLLILLVFCVGAFQRTTQAPVQPLPRVRVERELLPIGGMEISQDFESSGDLVRISPELQAVASIVREHDIRALITLTAVPSGSEADLAEVEHSIARLDALKAYFLSNGLPESSFRFFLGGPEAREGKVVVRFEEESHDNLAL